MYQHALYMCMHVASPCMWDHRACGITVHVASPCMWHHRACGITMHVSCDVTITWTAHTVPPTVDLALCSDGHGMTVRPFGGGNAPDLHTSWEGVQLLEGRLEFIVPQA